MMQRRLTIKEILQGLQVGGLKSNKYRNVYAAYAILRQREAYKADVINVDAKLGIAEWNPGDSSQKLSGSDKKTIASPAKI